MEENERPEYIFDDAVDMIHKETHIPKWLIMNVLDSEDHYLMHIGVEYIFDDAVDMIHKETHIPKWLIMNVLDSEDHYLMHIGVMDNDPSIVPVTKHYFWRKIKEFVRFK